MDVVLGEAASPFGMMLVAAAATFLLVAALFVALWALARRDRRRERALRAAAERSALDAGVLLAEQTARLRMVGELDEIAVDSVSAIVRHAEGARYAAEADPGAAVRSAAVIADTARATLDDLRRMLAIVRHGETDAGPQPGIATARDLFRVMREAGLEIRFEETGERFDLKPGADLAIYRILQEALSNVLTYGGEGTAVTVTFRWNDDGLSVLIDDDGVRSRTRRQGMDPNRVAQEGGYTIDDDAAALTGAVSGPGITEMRERTEVFGGVFYANVVPGVGFSVAAVFPSLRADSELPGQTPARA